jgi:hypothetical protein
MRGSICGMLALVASLALAALGQRAQEPPSPNKPVRYKDQPFTAEFRVTTVVTQADGTADTSEEIRLQERDSQRRWLFKSTDVASGITHSTVNDPVAGTQTVWNSVNKLAKLLKLPISIPERKSCWKTPDEELNVQRGEVHVEIAGITCPPADSFNQACTGDSIAIAHSGDDSPAPKASFADCTRSITIESLGGASEEQAKDLGTEVIRGYETHGCRVTTAIPEGTVIRESWVTGLGQAANRMIMPLRRVNQFPYFRNETDMRTHKQTEELISLTTNEPDPATFQPPKDYEIKTAEMHEVPCEELRPTSH